MCLVGAKMQNNRIKSLLQDIETVLIGLRDDVVAGAGTADVMYKADGSEQTDMDVRVEQTVFDFVKSRYPEVTFYGEETGYGLPLPELCCLLDPIDGTKSYVEGTDGYTAMAVLILNNVAVGSIIYRYTDGASFIAIKGSGATKNGEKISLQNTDLPRTIYCRERMIPFVQQLPELHGYTVEKGPTGAGYGFALVAEGAIAARINATHSVGGGGFIHDYAPGTLLVEEAGGSVVPFEDKPYAVDTFSFVACHPALSSTVSSVRTALASIEVDSLGKKI